MQRLKPSVLALAACTHAFHRRVLAHLRPRPPLASGLDPLIDDLTIPHPGDPIIGHVVKWSETLENGHSVQDELPFEDEAAARTFIHQKQYRAVDFFYRLWREQLLEEGIGPASSDRSPGVPTLTR